MVRKPTPAPARRADRARLPGRSRRMLRRLGTRPVHVCRRVVAAALLLAAIALAVSPADATQDPTVPTVVAARDLAPGTVVRPADLRASHMPDSERPPDALKAPESASGRLLAGPLRGGEPLTNSNLLWQASGPDGEQGTATVPIRLADAGIAELLHPGTRVDVVTADGGEAGRQVLAETATVISLTSREASPPGAGRAGGTGPLVLIAVPAELATNIAAAGLGHSVTVTLR